MSYTSYHLPALDKLKKLLEDPEQIKKIKSYDILNGPTESMEYYQAVVKREKGFMDWDEYFIRIADQVKLKSKDMFTQIGAVIVGKDKEIVSTGYNSFPRGISDDEFKRQERPEKYFWFEHAERNAIYNAARIGVATKECTIYISSALPCADCTRGIINAGIKRVVCKRTPATDQEKWKESFERSKMMLIEAGVEISYYEADIL